MRVEPYLMFTGRGVCMPLGKTFRPPCCGMCAGRFGVSWTVGLDAQDGPAA